MNPMTTYITQPVVRMRFIKGDSFAEEMLVLPQLTEQMRAEDIHSAVMSFFSLEFINITVQGKQKVLLMMMNDVAAFE